MYIRRNDNSNNIKGVLTMSEAKVRIQKRLKPVLGVSTSLLLKMIKQGLNQSIHTFWKTLNQSNLK